MLSNLDLKPAECDAVTRIRRARKGYSIVRFLRTATAMFTVAACSSAPPQVKEPEKCKLQKVTGAIIASPNINPSSEGEPRPVQFRLYQIKSDVTFQNASFEKIWKEDKATLGDDLVKVEEFPVYPNTRSNLAIERDPSAQFIVAAGFFREPKGKSWFYSFELPPPPTAGSCGAACVGPNCDAGTPRTPRIYVWIDDTRVDDGSDHSDEAPVGRTFTSPGAAGASCDPAGTANKAMDAAQTKPPELHNVSVPSAPKAPEAPNAPKGPSLPKGF